MNHRNAICILAAIATLSFCGCQAPRIAEAPESSFVTVIQEEGTYWFSHAGTRFIARGVNCVLPADGSDVPDGQKYHVLNEYADIAEWISAATNRLAAWHFNTVAAWSDERLYDRGSMYHTRVIWFGPWGEGRDMRLIDVFSDEYAASLDDTAREFVAPHADDPWLIGYFANNELPWYGERGWPTDPNVSLLTRYMQLPRGAAGKQRLVAFLEKFYENDFAALTDCWDIRAAGFDELLDLRRMSPRKPVSKKAIVAWAGIVADQYFRLCEEAIRRYDPNHLFLGSRFAGGAYRSIIEACGRHADVISINHYRKTGQLDTRQLGAVAALTGKPLMITEFSWRAMENSSGCGNTHGADVTVATQEDRADAFELYVTTAARQPYIIGYDWFQYFDQPPGGRFDGEDSNYGLVDIYDQPYTTLLAAVARVNADTHRLHADGQVPFPEYDSTVLIDYQDISLRGTDLALEQPVKWLDPSADIATYGDEPGGASIEIVRDEGIPLLDIETGSGWGCGLTVPPMTTDHPDGSANVLGAERIIVTINASGVFRFNVGLNESGHGPVEAQTFDGYGHADGEAYTHMIIEGQPGLHEYTFFLSNMEQHPYHGNQRGNKTIDTDALAQIGMYFPGEQGEFRLTLQNLRIE
jgi:agarase